MRFLITAAADPNASAPSAPPSTELIAAYMRFNEELHKAGVLVAAEGVNPAAKGARVGVSGGKRVVEESDIPPEMVKLIREVAPTWSSTWSKRR
jgi:hypothetical protein